MSGLFTHGLQPCVRLAKKACQQDPETSPDPNISGSAQPCYRIDYQSDAKIFHKGSSFQVKTFVSRVNLVAFWLRSESIFGPLKNQEQESPIETWHEECKTCRHAKSLESIDYENKRLPKK